MPKMETPHLQNPPPGERKLPDTRGRRMLGTGTRKKSWDMLDHDKGNIATWWGQER